MDINQILEIIPKHIHEWNQKDIEVWLTFIQLPQLIPNFKTCRIDGSRLISMNQEALLLKLGIKSNIIKKKLINWIQYLESSQQYSNQYLTNPIKQTKYKAFDKCNKIYYEMAYDHQTEADQCPSQAQKSQNTVLTKQLRPQKNQGLKYTYIADHENLHISHKNQNENKYLACDQTSISFGRNPNNNFFLVQRDIEPYHCAIVHRQNRHYIVCPLQNSGVWVQIPKRIRLQKKTIIEMGEVDFEVYIDDHILTIVTFGSRYEGIKFQFLRQQKQIIRVGRRSTCDIALPFDTTLSGYHGKFIYEDGWYFEDLQTTNGSWYKIQKEELVSDRMIFRIGKSQHIFKCKVFKNEECQSVSSRSSEFGTCRQCRSNEKNCYFRPCYHNQFCFQCGHAMDVCRICNSSINQIEKIYKI